MNSETRSPEETARLAKRNLRTLWARTSLTALAGSLAAGSITQALWLKLGITAAQMSYQSSMIQILSLAGTFLLASVPRRIRNTKRAWTITFLLSLLIGTGNIFLCLNLGWSTSFIWVFILAFTGISSVITSLRTIFDYKLPCEVLDMNDYSYYIAVDGILIGLIGMPASFLMPLFYARWDFMTVTAITLGLSTLFNLFAAFLNSRLVMIFPTPVTEADKGIKSALPFKDILMLWRNKEFLALAFPNFIRGMTGAVTGFLPTLALTYTAYTGFTEVNISLLTGVTSVATFLSCAFYGWAGRAPKRAGKSGRKRRIPVPMVGLIGGVLGFAFLPLMHLPVVPFLCFYFFAYVGYNLMANALPNMIYDSVSAEIMSPFQTWRLGLTSLGQLLSTLLLGQLIGKVDGTWLMLACALSLFLTVFCYWIFFMVQTKKKARVAEATAESN